MKVIHLPIQKGNPYQKLLVENLNRFPVQAKYGKGVGVFTILYNFIRHFRVHILHIHWQHRFLLGKKRMWTWVKSIAFIAQLLFVKKFNTRIVWTVHNLVNHEDKHKDIELRFSRMIARYADAIIVHCHSAKIEVEKALDIDNDKKIHVIPHGNFFKTYRILVDRRDARRRLQLNENALTFLYFGLIRHYKGVFELVESFTKLANDSAILIIAGKPRDENIAAHLKKKTGGNNNIKLRLGFVPPDEVHIYFQVADIVVLPYLDVLSSGTAMLALSFGKPVIAPYVGCIPEMVNGSNCFFYKSNDKNGLLYALEQASRAGEKLKEMGISAYHTAEQYGWEKIGNSTYNVYEKCMTFGG